MGPPISQRTIKRVQINPILCQAKTKVAGQDQERGCYAEADYLVDNEYICHRCLVALLRDEIKGLRAQVNAQKR